MGTPKRPTAARPVSRPSRKARQLPVWDILVNDRAEVLIAIDTQPGDVAGAFVTPHAGGLILARNAEDAVFLADVPEKLLAKVLALPSVLVAETDDGGIRRDYSAQVKTPQARTP